MTIRLYLQYKKIKMRKHLLILLFITPLLCVSQSETPKIGLNSNGTKLLIFPKEIDFTVLGDHYNFVEVPFKNSSSQYGNLMLGLQFSAKSPATEAKTNYTVVTKDGAVYDFILELDQLASNASMKISPSQSSLSILNRNKSKKKNLKNIIQEFEEEEQDSILPKKHYYKNNKTSEPKKTVGKIKADDLPLTEELYKNDKAEYIRRKCYYNQFKKGSIVKYFARSDKVFLWLKEVYYNNNEMYFLFRLDNEETIDYDIKLLRTSIGTNYKKSSSNQKSNFNPDHTYKVPKRVKGNTSNYFFLVYDKFTLDRNKDLVVQLDEINGNRNITLTIDRTKVNRPKRF